MRRVWGGWMVGGIWLGIALVAVVPARGGSEEGDAVRGRELFGRRCAGCHALEKNREGPMLRGVYGRAAGSVEGFAYSAALKKSGVVWDGTALERWLTDPEAMVPGTDMDFRVVPAGERGDVVRFLKEGAK